MRGWAFQRMIAVILFFLFIYFFGFDLYEWECEISGLKDVLNAIRSTFSKEWENSSNMEIAIEANPFDIVRNPELPHIWKDELGVNRISLGVQVTSPLSFHIPFLMVLTRSCLSPSLCLSVSPSLCLSYSLHGFLHYLFFGFVSSSFCFLITIRYSHLTSMFSPRLGGIILGKMLDSLSHFVENISRTPLSISSLESQDKL